MALHPDQYVVVQNSFPIHRQAQSRCHVGCLSDRLRQRAAAPFGSNVAERNRDISDYSSVSKFLALPPVESKLRNNA